MSDKLLTFQQVRRFTSPLRRLLVFKPRYCMLLIPSPSHSEKINNFGKRKVLYTLGAISGTNGWKSMILIVIRLHSLPIIPCVGSSKFQTYWRTVWKVPVSTKVHPWLRTLAILSGLSRRCLFLLEIDIETYHTSEVRNVATSWDYRYCWVKKWQFFGLDS